jgi:hypothetical protein
VGESDFWCDHCVFRGVVFRGFGFHLKDEITNARIQTFGGSELWAQCDRAASRGAGSRRSSRASTPASTIATNTALPLIIRRSWCQKDPLYCIKIITVSNIIHHGRLLSRRNEAAHDRAPDISTRPKRRTS